MRTISTNLHQYKPPEISKKVANCYYEKEFIKQPYKEESDMFLLCLQVEYTEVTLTVTASL